MSQTEPKHSVLFVCLGNICRSSLAEGIFKDYIDEKKIKDQFLVESAGISDFHAGEGPDDRAVKVAAQHGVDISNQRSRQLTKDDFAKFKWIICMDSNNKKNALRIKPKTSDATVELFMKFVPGEKSNDVPDPYYDGIKAFEQVYDLISRGVEQLFKHISGQE